MCIEALEDNEDDNENENEASPEKRKWWWENDLQAQQSF